MIKGRRSGLGRLLAPLCFATAASAQDISLAQPVDCTLGDSCFVQLYVDREPGPEYRDFTCGALSYDGHTGTDFAVPTLKAMGQGVAVLAAAEGRVSAVRDGMPDISIDTHGAPDPGDQGCGNGVVLDHGEGWRTQYCHLRLGTVAVQVGDRVAVGTRLGDVGLSGNTTFPHLEFIVSHNGRTIDPFAPEARTCGGSSEGALWATPIAYRASGLIAGGFAPGVPKFAAIKTGLPEDGVSDTAAPLVLWGYLFGAEPGDRVRLEIVGPNGTPQLDEVVTLDKRQYTAMRAVGRRAPEGGWAPGDYTGTITLVRAGQTVETRSIAASLP